MLKNLKNKIWLALLSSLFLLLASCDNPPTEKKELLIYCGITMVKPIEAIAKELEKQENVKIQISQGGSADLYQSLKHSQKGDLYLPGSESYLKKNHHEGYLKDSKHIGYNQASLMVQKNNPKNILADINQLFRKDLSVVLCNPESGSIGRETKKILDKLGIYEKVNAKTTYLTSDSRTMNNALKNQEADVILNWRATAFFKNNIDKIDVLDLPNHIAKPKKLVISLLSFSKNPELAKKFMDYASSEKGQQIFRNHGFLDKDKQTQMK